MKGGNYYKGKKRQRGGFRRRAKIQKGGFAWTAAALALGPLLGLLK